VSQVLRVAALQLCSTPDKSRNLAQAHGLIAEAADRGAQLVALPENFALLTEDSRQFLREAETPRGALVETLREWAAEYDVWLLAGSVALKAGPRKVTNSSLLFDPQGELVARYDKIHLFDVELSGDRAYRESKHVKPGNKAVLTKTPWGYVGLSICYDLRFPELYRKLSHAGARVLMIPSAFTAFTGKAHWDSLTRARAIENQCFVIAPAQTGSPYPGRETHGHTRIIDPWGRVLAERPAGTGMVYAELSFAELERVRRELPALRARARGL
jgi:nitrilase